MMIVNWPNCKLSERYEYQSRRHGHEACGNGGFEVRILCVAYHLVSLLIYLLIPVVTSVEILNCDTYGIGLWPKKSSYNV